MVDGYRSKLVNIVSGVPQGSVLAHYCSSVHFGAFQISENKMIGYADDFTLMAAVQSPGVRVTVAEHLIRNVGRVSEWCVVGVPFGELN